MAGPDISEPGDPRQRLLGPSPRAAGKIWEMGQEWEEDQQLRLLFETRKGGLLSGSSQKTP